MEELSNFGSSLGLSKDREKEIVAMAKQTITTQIKDCIEEVAKLSDTDPVLKNYESFSKKAKAHVSEDIERLNSVEEGIFYGYISHELAENASQQIMIKLMSECANL